MKYRNVRTGQIVDTADPDVGEYATKKMKQRPEWEEYTGDATGYTDPVRTGARTTVVAEPGQDGPPVTFAAADEAPKPPPATGTGSGVTAWREYAALMGVDVAEDADKDTVVAALTAAGVAVE